MACQQPGISHIRKTVPLHRRSWESHRSAQLFAYGGVDRQRSAHVHGVSKCITDNCVRTMDAPAETITYGSRKDLVFLCVVKVLDIQPFLLFAERRCGQSSLSICLKWPQIMLQTGD